MAVEKLKTFFFPPDFVDEEVCMFKVMLPSLLSCK